MNKTRLMLSGLLTTTLSSLALTSLSASAATLVDKGSDEDAFISFLKTFLPEGTDPKIGEVEGIAGGTSKELFFGLNGSSTGTPQSSADLIWQDGFTYDWTLTWDPATNEALFTITNPSGTPAINYTFAPIVLDKFNAFGLIARADSFVQSGGKVEDGTTMNLTVTQVDFSDATSETVNDSVTATAGTTRFAKQFYVIDDPFRGDGVEITQMTGTFMMDWDENDLLIPGGPQSVNANARIGFELKLFDPPGEGNEIESVPEPSSILGLLSLGSLGFTSRLKRKKE